MLTRIRIKNFKWLGEVDIELGPNVVLIGPNNSGKTTVLQALALWELGLRKWKERRKNKSAEMRPGVTINRRDLIAVPIPNASLLWRDLHMREVNRVNGKLQTANIRIDIVVEGESDGQTWVCGLEFDYANDESFYCRPLRLSNSPKPSRMEIPEAAVQTRIAFLPPMSGLASTEPKWEPGRVNVLLGEGQTAQVLRNLCYQIWEEGTAPNSKWERLCGHIESAFGVRLNPPQYLPERGEITMDYREKETGPTLDLSASGRGLQQTMLLLAHLYANPGRVLLLDEPDAHLEILRQREIYHTLTTVAAEQGSQVIAASHSEVVLNEAADKDIVIAFIGKPHRIDNRKSKPDQVLKALRSIGYEQYAQAEQRGWVLYVEGSTDLDILRAFASKLNHPAQAALQNVFVHYVENQPRKRGNTSTACGKPTQNWWGSPFSISSKTRKINCNSARHSSSKCGSGARSKTICVKRTFCSALPGAFRRWHKKSCGKKSQKSLKPLRRLESRCLGRRSLKSPMIFWIGSLKSFTNG
jgi:ABC-type transport system involved in cytochrome c biogenesis ATPase subunit